MNIFRQKGFYENNFFSIFSDFSIGKFGRCK